MKLILDKSDTFGAISSLLCLVHCITTPFVIIVLQTYASEGIIISPIWWQNLDSILLIISLIAVAQSSRFTSKKSVKIALWSCWTILSFFILNEKFNLLSLPELGTYVSSLSLAGFHIYNLKFCRCNNCECETQST